MFKSRSARLLAIRQVTQLNKGKITLGVYGIAKLNEKGRLLIFEEIKNLGNYKDQSLKKVYIPKLNREKRHLGIPTIKDRIIQCLMKYILELVYKAYASEGSSGVFAQVEVDSHRMVMMNIFFNLRQRNTNYKKRILELDIEKCLDKINHVKLMNEILLPIQMQRIIRSALKLGVLHERSPT